MKRTLTPEASARFKELRAQADAGLYRSLEGVSSEELVAHLMRPPVRPHDIDVDLALSTFTKMGDNDSDKAILSQLTFETLSDEEIATLEHPRYLSLVTLHDGRAGTIVLIHDATNYELEVDGETVTISEADIDDH